MFVEFDGRTKYTSNDGKNNLTNINYSTFSFGSSNLNIYAKVDTNEFANGFSITNTNNTSTFFRMIPKTENDKFLFLYQYTDTFEQTNRIMLSSFMNPFKKIRYFNDTTIQTYNTTDTNTVSQFQFNITPVVEGFDSNNSVVENINVLYNDISNNPQSIFSNSSTIKKLIQQINTEMRGNAMYHSTQTKENLNKLLEVSSSLNEYQSSLSTLQTKLNTLITKLPIRLFSMLSPNDNHRIRFNYSSNVNMLNNMNMNNIITNIQSIQQNRGANEPELNISLSLIHI